MISEITIPKYLELDYMHFISDQLVKYERSTNASLSKNIWYIIRNNM